MKNSVKTIIAICMFVFSGTVFGQDLLGKDYDYVINILKKNNREYKTEKLDNDRMRIREYSKWYKDKEEVSESYYFAKKGKQMICKMISISSPQRYYGSLFWDDIALRLLEGYEKTDYLVDPLSVPVYKAIIGKWFKTNHYMSVISLSDDINDINDIIIMDYYLDTSSFKTK